MKNILKKALIPVFLSTICGSLCGSIIYKIYSGNNDLAYENNIIYLIQSGAYSTYDSMLVNSTSYNYIYYEEDNLFKTVIGITKNKENLEKIKNTYGKEVIINSYYNNNTKLGDKISEYDLLLSNEEDGTKIKEIISKMLNLYKEENNAKLIKVS